MQTNKDANNVIIKLWKETFLSLRCAAYEGRQDLRLAVLVMTRQGSVILIENHVLSGLENVR